LTYLPIQFADTSDASGGLGAFNINLKDFIFQLITFVLVLAVLRKWVLGKARAQADEAIAEAKKAAAGVVANAETAAAERANLIIKEAESRLAQEREKLRAELRRELADLVADATEKIIHEKLDAKQDVSLIDRAIRGLSR
jgi:F0F1-type ATP synthase membrane subunit b/b'